MPLPSAPTIIAATPSPAVSSSPTPVAIVPASQVEPVSGTSDNSTYWLAALAAGVLAALALGWTLLRRRRPVASGDDLPPAAEPHVARARVAFEFRPVRAGLNLLSATSENEAVLANTGDALATDIRLAVTMIAAHADQDADLAAFYAEPVGRPATAPFDLAPGEQRTIRTVAALAREAIRPLTAAGRPMFVPIVAVNATYMTAGVVAQTAQAFAVGIERVDSAKLAPFWLDALPKSFDQVAARPQGTTVQR